MIVVVLEAFPTLSILGPFAARPEGWISVGADKFESFLRVHGAGVNDLQILRKGGMENKGRGRTQYIYGGKRYERDVTWNWS